MKIIGTIGHHEYLVEATAGELQRMSGFDVETEAHRRGYRGLVGFKFDVHAAWMRVEDLTARADDLARAANAMRALADLLTDKLDVVKLPPKPEETVNG